ncbi:MAG TPA: hypothetical protein VLY21_05805 [Nitrososphaerales archaeon]|nr:hypothetical protein [Nitrososphaerales archaeon]
MTKFGALRLSLTVAALVVLAIGVALFYQTGVKVTPVVVSQEKQLCSQPISTLLVPSQSVAFSCPAVDGGWVTASISSAYSLTYQVLLSNPPASEQPMVNPLNGTKFTMDLPVPSNGTISIVVTDSGPDSTTISGSYSSAVEINVQDVISQPSSPYRLLGGAVAGVGALAAFFLIWDPAKVTTRALGRLSGAGTASRQPQA